MRLFSTIKSRMFISIILTVLLIALALGLTLSGVRTINSSFDEYLEINQSRMNALRTMYGEGLLAGIATRNKVFNPSLDMPARVVSKANDLFNDGLSLLREKDRHAPVGHAPVGQAQALRTIESQWRKVVDARKRVLQLAEEGNTREAARILAEIEHPPWQQIRLAIDSLLKDEQQLADESKTEARDMATKVYTTGLGVGLLAILMVVVVNFLIMRSLLGRIQTTRTHLQDLAEGDGDLTKRLVVTGNDEITELSEHVNHFIDKVHSVVTGVRDSTLQLASAAEEVATITSQSEQAIQTQRGETEQVATAMNEMTATVQSVAENAVQASSATNEADDEARRGNEVMDDTVSAINALAGQVQTAVSSMDEVNQSSVQISGILDVINGIAEQTNLLALNAAIEAARAGEQGRGFSVVADEVRTLAQRTQQATQEVDGMIAQLQAATESVTTLMTSSHEQTNTTVTRATEAQEALKLITSAVAQVTDMNISIANAAEEQSAVAEEINRNVISINDASEQVSTGATQTTQATAELAELAEQLRHRVGQFRL